MVAPPNHEFFLYRRNMKVRYEMLLAQNQRSIKIIVSRNEQNQRPSLFDIIYKESLREIKMDNTIMSFFVVFIDLLITLYLFSLWIHYMNIRLPFTIFWQYFR